MEKSKQPKKIDEEIKEKQEETNNTKDILEVKQDSSINNKKLKSIVLLQRLIKGRNEQNKM